MEAPELQPHIVEGLKNIRAQMRLQWNPRAVLSEKGGLDANGMKIKDPVYEARWEVWDTTPDGMDYMVLRVQTVDGKFRQPGDWLVHHISMLDPNRWGGDINRMVQALIDDPTALREVGTEKDSDDLIEAASKWAAWTETPKSGAGLTFRGKRHLSA